eukprot:2678566-Prorocentrum_lima.AAC.1
MPLVLPWLGKGLVSLVTRLLAMAKHGTNKAYDIFAKGLDYIYATDLQAEGHPAATWLLAWARLVVELRLPVLMEGWLAMGRE